MKQYKLKYHTTCLVVILFCFFCKAQNETNNWYFGANAGIDFNNGQFALLNDSSMSTPDGCSSISDSNGNLLFYTNGETVWNQNHEIMTNGNDLKTEIENNQSSIIVPDPSDTNNYYIITTSIDETYGGIFYSKVVFNTQNPLGHVFTKNNRLTNFSTERITAVYSPDTNSYKVVGLGKVGGSTETTYNALFVINVGTLGTAPLNNITLENTIILQETYFSTLGTIKFSPNGQLLAIGDSSSNSSVYIYSFNSSNDTVTFQDSFNAGYIFNPIPIEGLEFSADSEFIYITGNSNGTAYLHKYVINSPSTFNEKFLIATSANSNFGFLQLASNSKIYMAQYTTDSPYHFSSLGVINKPEETDDVNFVPSSVPLNNAFSTKGLPNFVTSYFRNRIIVDNECFYNTLNFSLEAYSTITNAFWEFGDGNTANGLTPSHQYTQPGAYTVKATITIGSSQIELYKRIQAYPIAELTNGYTISQCDVDNDGLSFFNLTEVYNGLVGGVRDDYQYDFYTNLQDAQNETNQIGNPEYFANTVNPQEVFLNIITEFGCVSTDSFFLEVQNQDLVTLDPYIVCDDSNEIADDYIGRFDLAEKLEELNILFDIMDDEFIRFHGSLDDALSNTNPIFFEYDTVTTTLWVIVRKTNGDCGTIASMELIVNQPLELEIEDSYQLCELQPNPILDGGISNTTWEWSDTSSSVVISTQRFFELSNPGTYQLTVTSLENGLICTQTKGFTVLAPVEPTFENIEINGTNLIISIDGASQYEFSLNNQDFFGQSTSYTFNNVEPGIIEVFVRDINDCEQSIQTEVSFIYYPSFFTPNDDNKNDTWSVYGINDNLYKTAEVAIFDRYGKKLYSFTLKTINQGWNGAYNNVPLPNSDYWFKAILVDKNENLIEKSGHFTLKR